MRRHCICKFVRVTIIYRHRYIRDAHAVRPSRAHLCGERANDFSTCSGYEWAPRRVGFTQTFFSSSWSILRTFGAIAGPWFPPEDKKKAYVIFLMVEYFGIIIFCLVLSVLFAYQNTVEILFSNFRAYIYLPIIFQFALSEYCAWLFCIVFLSDENSCTVFVRYKKC